MFVGKLDGGLRVKTWEGLTMKSLVLDGWVMHADLRVLRTGSVCQLRVSRRDGITYSSKCRLDLNEQSNMRRTHRCSVQNSHLDSNRKA